MQQLADADGDIGTAGVYRVGARRGVNLSMTAAPQPGLDAEEDAAPGPQRLPLVALDDRGLDVRDGLADASPPSGSSSQGGRRAERFPVRFAKKKTLKKRLKKSRSHETREINLQTAGFRLWLDLDLEGNVLNVTWKDQQGRK